MHARTFLVTISGEAWNKDEDEGVAMANAEQWGQRFQWRFQSVPGRLYSLVGWVDAGVNVSLGMHFQWRDVVKKKGQAESGGVCKALPGRL